MKINTIHYLVFSSCAIVLYQPVTNNQRHLMLPNKQVPTAISIWGKYVASGEVR